MRQPQYEATRGQIWRLVRRIQYRSEIVLVSGSSPEMSGEADEERNDPTLHDL